MVDTAATSSAVTARAPLFTDAVVPTTKLGWKLWYLRELFVIPRRSRAGARLVRDHVQDAPIPDTWLRDFTGRSTLIVGTGPSLDKVDRSFFDRFDTKVYINFALRQATFEGTEYFFTADISPAKEFCARYGPDHFRRLGPDRCVLASLYADQWFMLTEEGRRSFSWLRPDAMEWKGQRFNSVPLPVMWRYYAKQPDWGNFALPPPGRVLPILHPTSALTAILFAAMMGSNTIGMIGCDFSAGRAPSMAAVQAGVPANAFSEAAGELTGMSKALESYGITVTNYSWLV